jgi:hypothetical protein
VDTDDKAADRERLQAELTPKKISELKKQALAEGVHQQAIELVDDSDDPREALICLLLEAHRSTISNAKDQAEQLSSLVRRLRLELQPMRISALRTRAAEAGASTEEVEEATDAEDSKAALIELIVGHQNLGEDQAKQTEALRDEALRLELQPMRISALRTRAAEAGASTEEVEEATDAEDSKAALIELIVGHQNLGEDQAKQTEALCVEALRLELQPMRISALRTRAAEAGASTEEVEEATDAEDSKAALIELIVGQPDTVDESACRGLDTPPSVGTGDFGGVDEGELIEELASLKLTGLRKRAASEGVDAKALEDAIDSDDPKGATIALVVAQHARTARAADESLHELRQGLHDLRLTALRDRAVAEGADADRLDDATDSDDPKRAVIALIIAMGSKKTARQSTGVVSKPATIRKSHVGVVQPQPRTPPSVRSQSKPSALLLNGKHAMLSYQWDHQAIVRKTRNSLARHEIKTWMDIDGGMQRDLFESMAQGVEGAACIVSFLSQRYQDSENCKLELKFGKQSGVPIVPVMIQGENWRPTGWLGLVVAGSLWTTLVDDDFEAGITGLLQQIKNALPAHEFSRDGAADFTDESGHTSRDELRAELARLKRDLEIGGSSVTAKEKDSEAVDASGRARLPAGVPELPADYAEPPAVQALRQILLQPRSNKDYRARVGFVGMGGLGKTVTGSALLRSDDIRGRYTQLVWLPMGQAPVIDKLQRSLYTQLTGKNPPADFASSSEEEKHDLLRTAFAGRSVLLSLDDLWEEDHESQLNFIDSDTNSRVIISTRVRGLLQGGSLVDLERPDDAAAISILMTAAEMPTGVKPPTEALVIIEMCDRLPLALVMAGRLILQLGLGLNWQGVASILGEELRENEHASSEQRIIKASLAAVKGSARDQVGVRNLFSMFALVPEDTICPLDTMLLMYNAVYPPGKDGNVQVTLLHIRKWLKVLIDRSLVLGTVDKASLHDLVLDYTITLHTEAELRAKHWRVVEQFRASRTVDAAGVPGWVPGRVFQDTTTSYVLSEVQHHVTSALARREDHESEDTPFLSWLCDVPHDAINQATARVIGKEKLVALSEEALEIGDMWAAANYFYAISELVQVTEGRAEMEPFTRKSLETLQRVQLDQGASFTEMDKDVLEIQAMRATMFSLTDMANDMIKYGDRMNYLMTTDAAIAMPHEAAILLFFQTCLPPMFTGDMPGLISGFVTFAEFLVRRGVQAALDHTTRDLCAVIHAGCAGWYLDLMVQDPRFSWESTYGPDGSFLIQAVQAYTYAQYHKQMASWANNDFYLTSPAAASPLAVHYGNLVVANQNLDQHLLDIRRATQERDQAAEALLKIMSGAGGRLLDIMHLLGRDEDMAALQEHLGMTWSTAEATVDILAASIPFVLARGSMDTEETAFFYAETLTWSAKVPRHATPRHAAPRRAAPLRNRLVH